MGKFSKLSLYFGVRGSLPQLSASDATSTLIASKDHAKQDEFLKARKDKKKKSSAKRKRIKRKRYR